jgi:DNA-binding NarL/FixJ family response regulator
LDVVALPSGGGGVAGSAAAAAAFLESADELSRSPVPAVVLEVPTERIVAVTPSGALLLDPDGGTVIGRNFEDFTTDGPSGVLDLFESGRITGYEATRTLRRTGGADVRVNAWLHRFDHQHQSRFALVVFSTDSTAVRPAALPAADMPAVIGTTDESLLIERISNDTEALFGLSSVALLGRPLASVVDEQDQTALAAAIAEAGSRNQAVTAHLHARFSDATQPAQSFACHVVILPMDPAPSCGFVFLSSPESASAQEPPPSTDLAALLLRLGRAAEVTGLARRLAGVSDRNVPGLSTLTTRELEIVARLLSGDRVPAIAAELYLSPSTVRSHLAAVFGKLHVPSQQGLLDLFRGKPGPHH